MRKYWSAPFNQGASDLKQIASHGRLPGDVGIDGIRH